MLAILKRLFRRESVTPAKPPVTDADLVLVIHQQRIRWGLIPADAPLGARPEDYSQEADHASS